MTDQTVQQGMESAGSTRATALRRTALGLGAVASGAAVGIGISQAGGATLGARDRQILQFALELEQLQVHFYAAVLAAGKVNGEPRQFAETTLREERAHLSYLEQELGGGGGPAATYRFGDAVSDNKKFVAAAVTLEETGLGAYNGQAGNLSRPLLAAVARVISVEARHAAWARAMAGTLPAPTATDEPISAAKAAQAIRTYLA